MNKLEIRINPETNNESYIASKFNLALGVKEDIVIEVLSWKIETYGKMETYSISQRSKTEVDVWEKSLDNLEVSDIETFIEYVADFCERAYKGCEFEKMLELIKTRDLRKVLTEMIEPTSKSVWSGERNEKEELNFDDGIEIRFPESDYRMPLIRIEAFFDKLLDIDDDFAQEVNEILYGLKKDDSQAVIDILKEKYGNDIEDENGYMTVQGYTYNSENDFSRDFIYHIFEYNGDEYVFITIHHGADARVGFGSMVCFKINDIDYFFMWTLQVYDTVTDTDYESYQLEDIANYDIKTDTWIHKETGNEIRLYTVADGY